MPDKEHSFSIHIYVYRSKAFMYAEVVLTYLLTTFRKSLEELRRFIALGNSHVLAFWFFLPLRCAGRAKEE